MYLYGHYKNIVDFHCTLRVDKKIVTIPHPNHVKLIFIMDFYQNGHYSEENNFERSNKRI